MFIRGEFKHRRTTNKKCLRRPNLLSESYNSCFYFQIGYKRWESVKDPDLLLILDRFGRVRGTF